MGDAGRARRVEVGVLGPFRVSVDGAPVDVPSGRLRVLLAVLAMAAGRPVGVERLIDCMWGDDLPIDARRTVHTYLARVRKVVGTGSVVREQAGYVLYTPEDNVDALRFLRLVDRAVREPMVERELLVEALGVWRGDPFEGLGSTWLESAEGGRLKERRLSALERRIDLDLASGRASELVAELDDLTAEHPLRESLWSRYLLALGQAGRQAEALEQYERIRERIADELGVDPSPELRQIHTRLLDGKVLAGDGDDGGSTVADPGGPRQLPADIVGFTGRSAALGELDDLAGELADHPDGPKVVVMHGAGGVGKTTLTVHWAHRAVHLFPDGQLYLNLRGFGPGAPLSPATALESLLGALGVSGRQLPTEVEARSNLFRSQLADRRVLTILDNAYDAEQVRPLLVGSGESMTIVTSRSQLRGLVAREGADRIAIEQLDSADSIALLKAALSTSGDQPDPQGLAELADLCGHLPLALSIAAERANRYPEAGLAELVSELRAEQERLDALDVGDDADIRAVFAWSYRDLSSEPAALFRQLGDFPGGDISLQAAAALSGRSVNQTRRLLDHLVGVSLLRQHRRTRYELHDLLRAYAAELVEEDSPEDRGKAVGQLLDWYLDSALNAWDVLWPHHPLPAVGRRGSAATPLTFDSREQALAWFESERTTLLALVRISADRGQHEVAVGLSDGLQRYLARRRALDDLLEMHRTVEESARRNEDQDGLAKATIRIGIVFEHRGDYQASRTYYERARELYEIVGDRVGQGRALSNLGSLAMHTGRHQEAVELCEGAIEWLADVPREQAQGLNNVAVCYLNLGRAQDAYETAKRAVELGRDLALDADEAIALDTLAQAELALGRADAAIEHLREARQLLSAVGARWEEGAVVANLGRALSSSGDDKAAKEAWTEALEILDELGAPDFWEFNRAELRDLLAGKGRQTG